MLAVKSCFETIPGRVRSGQVGSGQVDGNSDNKANSAQFQAKLPTGAELGKKPPLKPVLVFEIKLS